MKITIAKPGLVLVQETVREDMGVYGEVGWPKNQLEYTPSVTILGLQHKYREEDAWLFWFDKLPAMPL